MPPKFVAELGSNTNGDFLRACRLVDAASKAGFSHVKTQHLRRERLFCKEALENVSILGPDSLIEMPMDWHGALKERVNGLGMKYGVTVFNPNDAEALRSSVDFFKVASYSLLDKLLLSALATMKLPLIVSTGMATMDECLNARSVLMESGADDITFLHCVSAYPAPPEQSNLRAIDIMQKMLCWPIGWSDHTIFPPVAQRAIERWRASMIEVHFDLADGQGYETEHSYTPRPATNLIASMREGLPHKLERISGLDGEGTKKPRKCEEKERQWRADPSDGLRPMMATREQWTKKTSLSS